MEILFHFFFRRSIFPFFVHLCQSSLVPTLRQAYTARIPMPHNQAHFYKALTHYCPACHKLDSSEPHEVERKSHILTYKTNKQKRNQAVPYMCHPPGTEIYKAVNYGGHPQTKCVTQHDPTQALLSLT
jgi:hypothetical protein